MHLHLAFDKLYRRSESGSGAKQVVRMTLTNSTKLARKPAPPAARPSWGNVNGEGFEASLGLELEYDLIRFCKLEYATNSAAVSAIDPTIGAGSP